MGSILRRSADAYRDGEAFEGASAEAKRARRGGFDFPESKIELDENGEPLSIHPHERNDATKLIEDFMLAANETVAQHFLLAGRTVFYTAYTITRIRKKCSSCPYF